MLPLSAQALQVSAEMAVACPQLEDFATLRAGGSLPATCVRIEKHMDLYGPVGRAYKAVGGPYVRVQHDEKLYWAEESAFYTARINGAPVDDDLAGERAPVPPIE